MALTPTDFKPRRLERYLATAWESGAQPAIVLTKPDLCADVDAAVLAVEAVAFGVPIHLVNALRGEGVAELATTSKGIGRSRCSAPPASASRPSSTVSRGTR